MVGASERGGHARRPRTPDARGIVTVEFACGILASIIVMIMLSWAIFLFGARIAMIDTVGEVARQAARGDTDAVRAAERQGPAGAEYSIRRSGSQIEVEASVAARPMSAMPVFTIRASAVAALEPGEPGAGR